MLIDLWQYVIPDYASRVTLSTGELCGVEEGALSHCWQKKNHNAEEFWINNGDIWRGRDTSMTATEFYDTYTDSARAVYGHRWLPRIVKLDSWYEERCYTVIRDKATLADKQMLEWFSKIHIAAFHEELKLQNGQTVINVVELHDYDANGTLFERKFYAFGWGLVKWINVISGATSEPTALGFNTPPLLQRTKYGDDIAVPADDERPYGKDLQTRVTIAANTTGLRVRTAPSTTAPILGYLPEILPPDYLTYTNAALSVERDGYWWLPFTVDSGTIVLWVASDFVTVTPLDPQPEPEPEPTPEPEPEPTPEPVPEDKNNMLTNPALSAPYTQEGTLQRPNGWVIQLGDFPNATGDRANVWTKPDPRGFAIESGQAQFTCEWIQAGIQLDAGHYTVGFDYQPDITPIEINNDGVRLAFNEDYFFNIIVTANADFYASDTPANRGALMRTMDLRWVNDYPSTGFADHSHKSRTLTTARYLTIDQPVTLSVSVGVASKWGRSSGKLYVKQCYITKRTDTPTPTPTPDQDGCLARILGLFS